MEFEPLVSHDMYMVFRRLTSRVNGNSFVSPMAAYFASRSYPGNITQGVQQLQFMYGNLREPKRRSKKRKSIKIKTITKTQRGPVTYLWTELYTCSMLERFRSRKFTMGKIFNRLSEFGKDRLDIIGKQVYKEYPLRFQSASVDSLERMSKCIESLSNADISRPEFCEDGLYTSENKDRWSDVDLNYICGISQSLNCVLNTKVSEFQRKPSKSKLRSKKYIDKYKPGDEPSRSSFFTDDLFYKSLIM